MTDQHDEELRRLQDQLGRERQRAAEDRAHFEHEAEQVRKIAGDRATEEIERIREEEENKRRSLKKKQAVANDLFTEPISNFFSKFFRLFCFSPG